MHVCVRACVRACVCGVCVCLFKRETANRNIQVNKIYIMALDPQFCGCGPLGNVRLNSLPG